MQHIKINNSYFNDTEYGSRMEKADYIIMIYKVLAPEGISFKFSFVPIQNILQRI